MLNRDLYPRMSPTYDTLVRHLSDQVIILIKSVKTLLLSVGHSEYFWNTFKKIKYDVKL